ncbi:MAG: phosphatidylserine decarboxylase [Gemmataceae bacterium]
MNASTLTPPQETQAAVKPTCVQPGGGFFMSLELFLGRLRRARLRLFRRGYLRHMEGLRRGQCPGCKHSILDPRDLKYWRNVCGYSFAEEDDPFRWRNELGFARYGLAEVACTSVIALVLLFVLAVSVNFAHWTVFLVPLVVVPSAFILYFFRDPDRSIPADTSALVSPADGTVTGIAQVEEPDFPGGRALRVSIFLSVFDVHVNRIPRTAQVVGLRYFPGKFLDARNPEAGVVNEQFWVDLEESNPPRRIRVKQISGAIARRIVNWLRLEEPVWAGARFGMIKFGSRTDVLIPTTDPVDVLIKVGDKVKGGSSVLLRFK